MEINFLQVLFQIFNFGVVLFFLNKFLYKPVRNMLEQREKKINDGLAAAQMNLKAQEEVEKHKKEEIAKARREAAKIIDNAKAEAKKQAALFLEKAKADAKKEASHIIELAEAIREEDKRSMQSTLKDLVVSTTKKLLAENLTAAEIDKITGKMVSKLK